MPDTGPIVLSVVVPTYNRASLVGRAVSSVLAGSSIPLEVVVVDDGSEDETETVVGRIADQRVRYIRVPHGGVSAARNAGASVAEGRWLTFLDSDDEVLPGWAEAMVGAVERSGGVAVCGGEAIDASSQPVWTWTPPMNDGAPPQQLAEMFLPGMFMLERDLFLESGGYVEELAFGENTELALRLLFLGQIPVSIEPRVLVRRHVVSTPRETYSVSRIASARFVLQNHPWLRNELPALWASYHALVGVHEARRRHWGSARRHFRSAVAARAYREHLRRLAVVNLPLARSKVWPARPASPDGSLRILLLVPEYPPDTGGIATYAEEMAHGLAACGQSVEVLVVRRGQGTTDFDEGSVVVHRRPQWRLIPGSRAGGPLGRIENASFVQRLAHAFSCRHHLGRLDATFNLVEGCDWMAGTLLLRRGRHLSVVVHVHGAAARVERRGRPSVAARVSESLEALALKRSRLITVPSPTMAAEVRARLGSRQCVRLVPCPTEVRADVARPGDTPTVLYVGRLDWLKAPEVLVRAGALLRDQVPNLELRFIGRPHGQRGGRPYGEWLADLAEEEKSPCRFLGALPHAEVLQEISRASVVAVTSRFEAFGLSGAEALGQGRPVVCTENCGISYLVTPPAGSVVPFDDAPALASALRSYLPGGALASVAPAAALAVARVYLRPEVVAEEKIACYREATL